MEWTLETSEKARLPNVGEKAALQGSSGIPPSNTNRYLDESCTSLTPLANAIPLADIYGKLDSWVV